MGAGNLNDYYYNQLEQLDIIDNKRTFKLEKHVEDEAIEMKSPTRKYKKENLEETKLYGKFSIIFRFLVLKARRP